MSPSFKTYTLGEKVHTFSQLRKDCSTVLASAKQFCRHRNIKMNEPLICGFVAAMGAEIDVSGLR